MKQLHDRATRGKTLLPEEREELDAWYAQEDSQEAEGLSHVSDSVPLSDLPSLRRKVYEARISLAQLANENQELAVQNDALRTDIAQLKAQLAARIPVTV